MENLENITQGDLELQVKDAYCIIKNKQDGFYWVINLEDHPNSFLLDQSFQNLMPSEMKEDQETMVIFQPTI